MTGPHPETQTQTQTRKLKFRRTANACVACRQSKIKCSGTDPCANCQRRGTECRFVEGNNKVVVTERYLQQLLRQVKGQQQQEHQQELEQSAGTKRQVDVAFGADEIEIDSGIPAEIPFQIDHGRPVWTSPFTLPSRTIKNPYKTKCSWIWLAPTSIWSFTARLSLMMAEKLHLASPYNIPNSLDLKVYPLHWQQAHTATSATDPVDISGLPSVDHALYLVKTVKFHLDQRYRLLDEDVFLPHIHEFYYGNPVRKATECRLWFVQFLLVLAFGNAFLLKSKDPPPGSKFFVRAMALMPEHEALWNDGLLAIEVLALAGLYLYSVDHRESAHVYIGQAIRIAQLDGLHTDLPEDEIGSVTVARCRNLWWTLYVMDRHFSSSLGVPMTTQDADITALVDPPGSCSQRDATLSLQVRLSRMLSFILTSIYKTEKTELGTFLEKTRSILQTMAGHAQKIESIIHLKFQNSVDTMPKGTRHITLLYHQCVIVATRPLLLSILKERLEKLGHGEEDWDSFLGPTKTLISTGIKSASKTLQILTDEDSLLEVFLPFELEFTYAAAIHLTMAHTLFPHADPSQTYNHDAHLILDEMIAKGNRLAAVRKSELSHLEMLFGELAARIERRGLQTLTLSSLDNEIVDSSTEQQQQQLTTSTPGDEPIPFTVPTESDLPQTPRDLEILDSIGISSDEFFSIVNQMGNPENWSMLDPAAVP